MLTIIPLHGLKVRAVLEYVQSERCRKIIFGEYFADTSGGQEKCGRCDNCVNPQTVRDLTYESWQVLKVAQDVHRGGGRLTLAQLADLARGLGGGRYTVSVIDDDTGANRKGKSSSGGGHIDLSTVSGGKVDLVKEDCEKLVVGLLVKGFLQDDYHYTAYAVNVYVQPGPQAIRLTRLTKAQAQTTKNLVKIAIPESRKGGSKPRASNADKSTTSSKVAEPSSATAKGKNRVIDDIDIDLDLEDIFDDVDDDDDVVIAPTRQAARQIHVSDEEDDNLDAFLDDDEDGDELEALLDAEADRRFGEVMHDEDDDDDEIDETNEEFRTSKRPRREEVVELDDEPMVPPIRHRPAAVPTPRAATSTNAPAAQRMATTSRSSPNGAPASGSDSGLRKRFRPYIPSAPSSSGSSSATLHRGTLASSSAGDHDADEDESLFAGIDLDMADEDGWQFNSVGTPRLGGRANFR
ncbi:hypothetical protein A4X09_0g2514 [Tilletia walkeri]|uniref:ATP-dependent DNA helicase RecQ zinc-binding domain-containing protein n=1 Tax=Tilletia walkeri TaxID=117179 RepID=A0A8X7ND66_9BASI|nr:hypothetical protein A4X09_0g2514 [Tilletia walkeri]